MLMWLGTVAMENICDILINFIYVILRGKTDEPFILIEGIFAVHVKAIVAGFILFHLCLFFHIVAFL